MDVLPQYRRLAQCHACLNSTYQDADFERYRARSDRNEVRRVRDCECVAYVSSPCVLRHLTQNRSEPNGEGLQIGRRTSA
jgi:hypothetical protein